LQPKRSLDLVPYIFALGLTASLVIGAVVIWTWSAQQTRSHLQTESVAKQLSDAVIGNIGLHCSSLVGVARFECEAKEIESSRQATHDARDLEAQISSAYWTSWATFISAAGFVLTFLGIWFVRENLLEMQRTRAVSQDALEAANKANVLNHEIFLAAQRPWLSVDCTLTSGIRWDQNGGNIDFRFVLQNTGESPAVRSNVMIKMEVRVSVDPLDSQMQFVNQQDSIRSYPLGHTVFPGQAITLNIAVNFPDEGSETVREWNQQNFGAVPIDFLSLVLVGHAVYQSALGEKRYQTGFIFRIDRNTPQLHNGQLDVGISRSRGDVPIELLTLQRWITDGITT
jgi:hypothetical protein